MPLRSSQSWKSASVAFASSTIPGTLRWNAPTWSETGLASSTPMPASRHTIVQHHRRDGEPAREVGAPQQRHERVQQQRHQPGDDEQQQHRARRAQDRDEAEDRERQQDELHPARQRRPAGRGRAAGGSGRGSCVIAGKYASGSLPSSVSWPSRTTILFVGDVVGSPGRRTLARCCPALREELALDFVVVNGENAAGGIGITPKAADDIFAAGADAITLGNHTYRHREVWPYLQERREIVRPANYLPSQPGRGTCVVERDGVSLGRGQPLAATCSCTRARPAFVEIDDGAARGPRRRPRARGHARRGDEREGGDGLVPGRAGDRGRRARTRTCRRTTRACSPAAPPTSPTSG